MKKTILIAITAWSMSAAAIPVETLSNALNSKELKSVLLGVQIENIQEISATKCPQCFQISIQGKKVGVLGSLVDYELTFSTEYNMFENKLMVTIESETKN